jgi:hypothetical protein
MSAAALLVEARAAGVTVTREGDDLRVRGRLTSNLHERLVALKPELVALLRDHRQVETSRAWSDAYARLGGSWPGRSRVASSLLQRIELAEAEAERLTLAYRAGTATFEGLRTALTCWEDLVRSAAWACRDCGRDAWRVTLLMDDGSRYCAPCLRGERTT